MSTASTGGVASNTANGVGGVGANNAGTSTTNTSVTAGCKPWPAAKLVPFQYAGLLFFETAAGPCRASIVDDSGTATHVFTYDSAGHLQNVSMQSSSGYMTELKLTWDGDSPTSLTYSSDGTVFAIETYAYDSRAVVSTYRRLDGLRPGTQQTAYVTTPEGYPTTMSFGSDPEGDGTYVINGYGRYVYENCRILKSCPGKTAEELQTCQDFTVYAYDTAGRLTSKTADRGTGKYTETYEYDCVK
ncbi:MAG TPA: hypothetical protein VIV60_12080 [Polyangiaceae bacterium]